MRYILLFLLLGSGAALAEDWTTTNGATYKGVTVLSHDAAFVTIMYADGGARIPLRTLSPDLQARFGYDAKKATADEAATVAKDKADRAALIEQQEHPPQAATPAPTAITPAIKPVAAPAPTVQPAAPPFDGGLVENGDFQQGDRSWEGDGKASRTGPGLIVQLDSSNWTRVYQSVQNDATVYTVKVTYLVIPGTAFSKNAADYLKVNERINVDGWENYDMGASQGAIFVTLGDPSGGHISYEFFQPQMNSTKVQTMDHTYPPVSAGGTKSFVVAFPPGTGEIDILTVQVTSH